MADGFQMPGSLSSVPSADWVLFNNLKRLSDNTAQNTARLRVLEECITRLMSKVDELEATQAAPPPSTTPSFQREFISTAAGVFGTTRTYTGEPVPPMTPTQPLGYGMMIPPPPPQQQQRRQAIAPQRIEPKAAAFKGFSSTLPPSNQQTWWPKEGVYSEDPTWTTAWTEWDKQVLEGVKNSDGDVVVDPGTESYSSVVKTTTTTTADEEADASKTNFALPPAYVPTIKFQPAEPEAEKQQGGATPKPDVSLAGVHLGSDRDADKGPRTLYSHCGSRRYNMTRG